MDFSLMSSMRAVLCSAAGVSEDEARDVVRWQSKWDVEAPVGATVAHAERPSTIVKRKCRLVGAKLTAGAAITANATNFLTIIVRKRLAGATPTATVLLTMALDTVTTDDVAAWVAKDLMGLAAYVTGTAPDFDFAAGDIATVEVTKTGGSGLVLPVCAVELTFEPRT
jgi:hypothetical protein